MKSLTFQNILLKIGGGGGRDLRIQLASADVNRTAARLLGHDHYLSQQRSNESSDILGANALLLTPNAFAQNEKTLNQLYLTHRLWEGVRPDSATLAQIKEIADQCPKDGGWSVYVARSIYAAFEPEAFWDINEGCGGAAKPSSTRAVEKSLYFSVVPNPALDRLWFVSVSSFDHELTVELFDLSGRVLKLTQVAAGQASAEINVSDIPAGFHYYRVSDQGKVLQSGKVVIAR